jgi:hypothetical protein
MRTFLRRTLILAFAVVAAVLVVVAVLTATDYFATRTDVHGTITRDGKPLEWPFEGGHLLVVFVPADRDPEKEPVRADTDRDAGTFRIPEIKAGKYLVAVHMFNDRHLDALRNKFDPNRSTIEVEVTADGQVIDVDLPRELPKDEPKKRPGKGEAE